MPTTVTSAAFQLPSNRCTQPRAAPAPAAASATFSAALFRNSSVHPSDSGSTTRAFPTCPRSDREGIPTSRFTPCPSIAALIEPSGARLICTVTGRAPDVAPSYSSAGSGAPASLESEVDIEEVTDFLTGRTHGRTLGAGREGIQRGGHLHRHRSQPIAHQAQLRPRRVEPERKDDSQQIGQVDLHQAPRPQLALQPQLAQRRGAKDFIEIPRLRVAVKHGVKRGISQGYHGLYHARRTAD